MRRRFFAVLVLVLDAGFALKVAPHAPGVFVAVSYLIAALVAIGAAGEILFGLSSKQTASPVVDSGDDIADPADFGIGALCMLLFAAGPFFIAVRGVYRGVLPALGSGPDVAFSQSPARFVLMLSLLLCWSVGCILVLGKLWRARRAILEHRATREES